MLSFDFQNYNFPLYLFIYFPEIFKLLMQEFFNFLNNLTPIVLFAFKIAITHTKVALSTLLHLLAPLAINP